VVLREKGGESEREGRKREGGERKRNSPLRGSLRGDLGGRVQKGGVQYLSLDLGLGLLYTKLHKNFIEPSRTFHLILFFSVIVLMPI
jgi:hypothetical protein